MVNSINKNDEEWEDSETIPVILSKDKNGTHHALVSSSLESRLAEIEETGSFETTVTVVKKKPLPSAGFSIFQLGNSEINPDIIELNKDNDRMPDLDRDLLELEGIHEQLQEENISNLNKDTAKIQHVKKRDKKKFINSLDENIQKITDFLIQEVAPHEIAFNSALERSKEKLSLILDIPMSELNISYEPQKALWRDALNAKTFNFLGDLLGISQSELSLIVEKHLIPQQMPKAERLTVEQAYERILPKLLQILELQKGKKGR